MPIERFTANDSTKIWDHLNRLATNVEEAIAAAVAGIDWGNLKDRPVIVAGGATKESARTSIGAGTVDSATVKVVWAGTQAGYEAIVFKDPGTLYFISES